MAGGRAPPTRPALATSVVSSALAPRQNHSFPSWGLREGRALNILQPPLKFPGCPNVRRGKLEPCSPSTQARLRVTSPEPTRPLLLSQPHSPPCGSLLRACALAAPFPWIEPVLHPQDSLPSCVCLKAT